MDSGRGFALGHRDRERAGLIVDRFGAGQDWASRRPQRPLAGIFGHWILWGIYDVFEFQLADVRTTSEWAHGRGYWARRVVGSSLLDRGLGWLEVGKNLISVMRVIFKKSLIRLITGGLMIVSVLSAKPVKFEAVPDEAQRVVIVANANDADSMELARYYATERAIPMGNICALPLSAGEEIDWNTYVINLQNPLQQWLLDEGWIEAIVMDAEDDAGRRKISLSGHNISYLVTCRGVPLKIRQTEGIPGDSGSNTSKAFATHHAAVDSELALIVASDVKRDGFVPNPKFNGRKRNIWEPDTMVRVARLDGPTYSAIRRMIDAAILVETQGLIGRAVVDIGGPHKRGDDWFGAAVEELNDAGWGVQVDKEKGTLSQVARVDNVAWYWGWYTGKINGPFLLPGFEFAPGAIALHLHSFSARSLRLEDDGGWSGPLIARGATATFGNVYEPYLEYTHQPQMLTRAFLGGATLGEAAYYAMPVLSWQAIVLGDPLYRPMTVALNEQWEARTELPGRLASYAAVRRVKNALSQPDPNLEDIMMDAAGSMREYPSLALALELGQLREMMGDRAGAVRELGVAVYIRRVSPQDWGLMAKVAAQLSDWDDGENAVKVWDGLLKQDLPNSLRLAWLKAAVPVGKQARQFLQVIEWEREISRLSAK